MALDRALIVKIQKWAIWLGLITILYLLRHLFPIFFLTFILSYIANTAVLALTRRFRHRKLNVLIVYIVLIGMLTGIGLLVVPRMINEARNLARIYIATEAARTDQPGTDAGVGFIEREAREIIDSFIIAVAGRQTFLSFRDSDAYTMMLTNVHDTLSTATPRIVRRITEFANHAFVFVTQFIIAIILSFLVVWNLPETRERVQRFAYGQTAEVYAEIAPGLKAFGVMLGRAFEAQTVVAIVNAALSAFAFLALGLPSIALLTTIVFFCSYIPILGMILSTMPAALLALKIGGFSRLMWLFAAILIIHAVEAYLLNPLIYGRHLHLHPLAVLVVLLVAEHLVGVWGLLLGVPIAAFVFKHVIEGQDVLTPAARPA